ncbi:MAG: class I SAM-dependent methyltransferase [Acidobacteria bacterium]|nr:class I SAM-dependent methyltransferase [Acidobacteriota bacterium]
MQSQQYEQLAETEDRHWWHRSRQVLTARYLDRMSLGEHARILDVGCGAGGTTRFLQQYGTVVGLDRSAQALAHARIKAPRATLVQGDANQLGGLFAPGSFDLITFFNVLYHQWMRDDQAIIDGAARLLRPGGRLLLTEPAFQTLWRRHDRLDMGKRRYRLRDFRQFFERAGLRSTGGQYFNALAVPACLYLALCDKVRSPGQPESDQDGGEHPSAEMALPGTMLNDVLRQYMALESRLLGISRIPIGVTLLAVARK